MFNPQLLKSCNFFYSKNWIMLKEWIWVSVFFFSFEGTTHLSRYTKIIITSGAADFIHFLVLMWKIIQVFKSPYSCLWNIFDMCIYLTTNNGKFVNPLQVGSRINTPTNYWITAQPLLKTQMAINVKVTPGCLISLVERTKAI